MREILLTHGKVALVDDEDFDKLNVYHWHASNVHGVIRVKTDLNKSMHWKKDLVKLVQMSRFIMDPEKNMVVDHIDGNTLNNQKSNLRVCTQKENCRNQHLYDRCTDKKSVRQSLVRCGKACWWTPYKKLEDIVI